MLVRAISTASSVMVPIVILAICLVGRLKGVRVYETFVEGAREGFDTAVRLIPFLVAMFVAIGMFRASGALGIVTSALCPVARLIGMPEELLPLAIIRPLSGSGALEIATNLLKTYGPDSAIGRMASTMQASSETTLYVVTVYFGAVGVKKTRHTLAAGLLADLVAFSSSVVIWRLLLGSVS
ncbi:MAG: spore maturation protein [Firmicutes bacterium]|jgi:spore maturation protein B|nr:spore maturation protein [Bacillota bacterium]MDH7494440.1 spore maturation protein [Bacillota bacterium]